MNLTLDPDTGTAQQKAWVLAAEASCKYPIDVIDASVTVTWGPCTVLNHAYMQTVPNLDGTYTITIEPWADDPANPNNGAVSSGELREFYMESLVHELGHIVAYMLIGTDELRTTAAGLFWTPVSGGTGRRTGTLDDWAPTGYPWAKAIQEAVAEAFKVAYYANELLYGNRTDWYIDEAQWPEFAAMFAPPAGFRDDFSAGTMHTDDAQGAMRLDARNPTTGSDFGAPPTWWEFQEWWFVRETGSLQIKTSFDDSAPGLPNDALAGTYEWWAAGIDAGPDAFSMQSPRSADAIAGVGILGVPAGQSFPLGVDPYHNAFALVRRDGEVMAAFIGRAATVGAAFIGHDTRLGDVMTSGCRMITRAWLPDPDGPTPPYWNEQALDWSDQDVYLRFEADNATGAVTLSVTRDAAGTDMIGSMSDAAGLLGNGAPMYVVVYRDISMAGPLMLAEMDPAPAPTQPLFTLLQWNYHDSKPAPYPQQGKNDLAAGSPRTGFVPSGA